MTLPPPSYDPAADEWKERDDDAEERQRALTKLVALAAMALALLVAAGVRGC